MKTNRYAGTCNACKARVEEGVGVIEWKAGYPRGHYIVWCKACYDRSDCSGDEDRCCGNRAYEDQCARACGFDTGW